MMVDLGKYALEVLLAYGVTFGLLAVLIVQSVLRSRRVKRELQSAEAGDE